MIPGKKANRGLRRPACARGYDILRHALGGLILPLILVAVWWGGAARIDNAFFLPGPARVWSTFVALWQSGRFLKDLLASLGRVGLGFLCAAVLGLPLGTLAGRSRLFAKVAGGTMDFLRQVPPVALVPLLILWLGLGEAPKLLVIVYASFFPIFLAAELGARQVDPRLLEVARVYGHRPASVLGRVILPSALPSMATGIRLGLGYGWRSLVVAEMLAAAHGLGALIVEARSFGRADRMLVGIFAIGVAGTILDGIFRMLVRAFPPAGREEGGLV